MTAVGIPSQRNCRYNTPSLPDLFVAQETEREFEQGLRIEFSLPPEMLCLVLSNNGEKIRKVKRETGVTRVVVDQCVFVAKPYETPFHTSTNAILKYNLSPINFACKTY